MVVKQLSEDEKHQSAEKIDTGLLAEDAFDAEALVSNVSKRLWEIAGGDDSLDKDEALKLERTLTVAEKKMDGLGKVLMDLDLDGKDSPEETTEAKPEIDRGELTEDEKGEFAEAAFEARSLVRLCRDRAEANEDGDLDIANAMKNAERHLDTICTLMDKAGIS